MKVTKYQKKLLSNPEFSYLTEAIKSYPRKIHNTVSCDFCGSKYPVFIYAATKMSTGVFRECWRWCACWKCNVLIVIEDWETLEQQIVEWMLSEKPELSHNLSLVRQAAHTSFQEFSKYAKRI